MLLSVAVVVVVVAAVVLLSLLLHVVTVVVTVGCCGCRWRLFLAVADLVVPSLLLFLRVQMCTCKQQQPKTTAITTIDISNYILS